MEVSKPLAVPEKRGPRATGVVFVRRAAEHHRERGRAEAQRGTTLSVGGLGRARPLRWRARRARGPPRPRAVYSRPVGSVLVLSTRPWLFEMFKRQLWLVRSCEK